MPNTNTAVITPKDIQSGVPSYEFRKFLAMEPDITAKLWPGVLSRDSLFRSDDVYVMNNEGQIVPSTVRMEDVGDYAYLGRLYARNSDGYLCQIQLIIEISDTLDFNFSAPITIPEPTAPSFWMHVFAFFGHKASKKLIQVCNEMAAFAAALVELESQDPAPAVVRAEEPTDQISMLDLTSQQVCTALESITLETLTPIEAMNELYKLKKMLGDSL